jgi:hypothetical protein
MSELQSCGIIFIDCWQPVAQGQWPESPPGFDFYANMVHVLKNYSANSLIFHTGTFGDLPLARELQPWHNETHAIDCMNLAFFQQHCQITDIKNWIVVGAHWQRCTHDKPMGFINLLNIKQQNPDFRVFSLPECTARFVFDDVDNDNISNPISRICRDEDYHSDGLAWRKNSEFFELVLQ